MKNAWLARGAAGIGLLLACLSAWAYTDTSGGWNMPTGVTEMSREVYRLHMGVFWVCAAIGFIVFGAMIISIVKHRRSVHPKPADFHESTTVEIIWTIIPFVILIGMAIPAAGTLIKMEDSRGSDLTIKVTGYQWKWHYDYLGENVSFFSTLAAESNRARQLKSGIDPNTVPNYLVDVDNVVVLPVNKKIRFLVTANDVIHAWWVPELAVKKDAIPGYVNEIWTRIEQPGVYRGVCAELCGRDHGFMPIVVKAVSEAEFSAWLAQQKGTTELTTSTAASAVPTSVDSAPQTRSDVPAAAQGIAATASAPAVAEAAAASAARTLSKDELMAQGRKVYDTNCVACHMAEGQGLPPSFPALKGSKVATGPVIDHVRQALNGKGLMTPFKHLSDTDLAAVLTYERNSWGNQGSLVQPSDVAGAR